MLGTINGLRFKVTSSSRIFCNYSKNHSSSSLQDKKEYCNHYSYLLLIISCLHSGGSGGCSILYHHCLHSGVQVGVPSCIITVYTVGVQVGVPSCISTIYTVGVQVGVPSCISTVVLILIFLLIVLSSFVPPVEISGYYFHGGWRQSL